MRDTETKVDIDVVVTGEYPGDGKPKPVVFPDPASAAVRGERVALLPLPTLIELKLASGLSAPHRLKDLADGSVSDLVEKGKGRHHPVSSMRDAPVESGCRRMTP